VRSPLHTGWQPVAISARELSPVQGLKLGLESPQAPHRWLLDSALVNRFYFLRSTKKVMMITRFNRCNRIFSVYYRKTAAIFGPRRQPKYKQFPSYAFLPFSPFSYPSSALFYRPRRLTSLCPCVPYLSSPYLFSAPPSSWHKAITRSTSQKTR
jgi:hypothetical protein